MTTSDIAGHIEAFAQRTPGWIFPASESAAYARACGVPACCVIASDDSLPRSAVHFVSKGARALSLANIVPLMADDLDIDQYNSVAMAFSKALRGYARRVPAAIVVSLTTSTVTLDDVITGTIPRRLFRRFLGAFPMSGHPNDIARLDAFTCSLFRFSRKRIDLSAFQCLLQEEIGWPSPKAEWCRNRIEIGLEVLAANKKF